MSSSRGTKCYTAYYVILGIEFALLLSVAALYTFKLVRDGRRAAAAAGMQSGKGLGCSGADDDLPISARWSITKILVVEAIALFGGTLATLLGLGGGAAIAAGDRVQEGWLHGLHIDRVGGHPQPPTHLPALPGAGLVASPLLLALDVTPLVASATSSTIVLATVGCCTGAACACWAGPAQPACGPLARPPPCCPPGRPTHSRRCTCVCFPQVGSSTISYAVAGRLNADYCLIYAAFCLVGGLLGVTVVNYVVSWRGLQFARPVAGAIAGCMPGCVLTAAPPLPPAAWARLPQVRRTGAGSLVCALMSLVVGAGAIICAAYRHAAGCRGCRVGWQSLSCSPVAVWGLGGSALAAM